MKDPTICPILHEIPAYFDCFIQVSTLSLIGKSELKAAVEKSYLLVYGVLYYKSLKKNYINKEI